MLLLDEIMVASTYAVHIVINCSNIGTRTIVQRMLLLKSAKG